jgi:phage FluMu protein Com
MRTKPAKDYIQGACANCNQVVFESLLMLDDAYNVWMGKCPHCEALNFLSTKHGLRGYCSNQMWLELPYLEEIEANTLSPDIPNQGSNGKPATMHGSNLGELLHKLRNG